ncbi:hypothetical protein BC777_0969 [Yoonia maricola]|uniref:Uncharacterized protein n=1 Tax=Yoonia maricola TaxID=420999 RepID=A0A2M8WMH2_9RHOB|nr:hypothetical protein [Yoonia maricola]PJI92125.1 hypothetical protein BC777_0969 [Yoonia maricola]
MTFFKLGSVMILGAVALTGCGANEYSFDNPSSADGMTYQEMSVAYDDLDPVEFSIIDTNNDYVVDAAEEDSYDITIDDR